MSLIAEPTELWKLGFAVIPSPQQCRISGGSFELKRGAVVALDPSTDAEDEFAAGLLAEAAREHLGFALPVRKSTSGAIRVLRGDLPPKLQAEGYVLDIAPAGITLRAQSAAGVYYGIQTLVQMVRSLRDSAKLPALHVEDWPDYRWRAITYDTKHHQDKPDYVRAFFRKIASYKINLIFWEWEDKLAYEKHPEIGAPGAFTLRRMQEFTAFARAHHVQLAPLVQGLGHVSFILKHKKHFPLREIAASNWEFCPLKEGTYKLLFDLWDDAIDATPGSEFIHVGTDETYEIGQGVKCGCAALAAERGKDYLVHLFLRRADEHIRSRGRTMVSWSGGLTTDPKMLPPKDAVCFDYGVKDRNITLQSIRQGYRRWVFTRNPLNSPIMPTMFPFEFAGQPRKGSAADTAETLDECASLGGYEGMVACSWDDGGKHNEMWNFRHVCGAEYSWSAHAPALDEFTAKFFVNYFGPDQRNLEELYRSMEKRMFFYFFQLQRRFWHYGPVGKMHLPDLPRVKEDLSFDPFWRQRYAAEIEQAKSELVALDRCADIIRDNLARPLRNLDNLEILMTTVDLCRHNAWLFLRLAETEENIGIASNMHWVDRKKAAAHLQQAAKIVAGFIAERKAVMKRLAAVWHRTRLVKGMSTKGKKFIHARDRARHFCNRVPDLSYHVFDEQRLDMEGWLTKLKTIIRDYRRMKLT